MASFYGDVTGMPDDSGPEQYECSAMPKRSRLRYWHRTDAVRHVWDNSRIYFRLRVFTEDVAFWIYERAKARSGMGPTFSSFWYGIEEGTWTYVCGHSLKWAWHICKIGWGWAKPKYSE